MRFRSFFQVYCFLAIMLFFIIAFFPQHLWATSFNQDIKLKESLHSFGTPPNNSSLIAESLLPGPENRRLLFVVRHKDQGMQVVIDGEEDPEYDAVGKNSQRFSPNGKYYSYLAKEGENAFMVMNGQEGKKYDGVVKPMFTPNNSKILYVAQQGDEQFVVVNGEEGTHYQGVAGKNMGQTLY